MEQKVFESILDDSLDIVAMPRVRGENIEYSSNIEKMKVLDFHSKEYKMLLRRQFELKKRQKN